MAELTTRRFPAPVSRFSVAVLTIAALLGISACSACSAVDSARPERTASASRHDAGAESGGARTGSGSTSSVGPDRVGADAAEATSALSVLSGLEVKGRAPRTGYARDRFGPRGADVDRNGCDTRNDILNRDLSERTWRPGTHDCVVLTGVLADPYTGRVMQFSKVNASAVQIDHVVALSDAWQTGAQGWSAESRRRFANDPANLLAVGGSANASKGDSDAASWLPPNAAFRCSYVARQVQVKAAYGLWVTPAERDAVARVLTRCAAATPADPPA